MPRKPVRKCFDPSRRKPKKVVVPRALSPVPLLNGNGQRHHQDHDYNLHKRINEPQNTNDGVSADPCDGVDVLCINDHTDRDNLLRHHDHDYCFGKTFGAAGDPNARGPSPCDGVAVVDFDPVTPVSEIETTGLVWIDLHDPNEKYSDVPLDTITDNISELTLQLPILPELVAQPEMPTITEEEGENVPALANPSVANPEAKNIDFSSPFTVSAADVLDVLLPLLPKFWTASTSCDGFYLQGISRDTARLTQRSIFIPFSGSPQVYVHGKLLPPTNQVYSFLDSPVSRSNIHDCSQDLLNIIKKVRSLEICMGASATKFAPFWKREAGSFIDSNPFRETRYKETCRSDDCEYLVALPKKSCARCVKISHRFHSRVLPPSSTTTPKKNKPYKYCTSAEKEARTRRKTKIVECLVKKNKRLELKIQKIIEEESVEVDEELNAELTEVVDFSSSTDNEDYIDFHKLFLQQQVKANQVKGKSGMRWHPLFIRWAIQMKMISSTAYSTMRQYLQLPSERTLFDYTHIYEEKDGVNEGFINDIADSVNKMEHSYQRFHVLLFDEIYISQKIAQNKRTGEIVGFCKLDEVDREILELKKKLAAEAEGTPLQQVNTAPTAKRILAYMVRGTASSVKSIVASYPIHSLTKEDLFKNTWEVVFHLELSGIKIMAFVCDGSEVNRSFFKLHTPRTPVDSGIIFDTVNIYAPDRPIFFFSDPPHIIKTARNSLESSGPHLSRDMEKNGEKIRWSTIVDVYKHKSRQTVKMLPKLTAAAVYLNSYTRMNVGLACAVASNSTVNYIKNIYKIPGTGELCIFGDY